MSDLTEFLEQRIAEDEAVARAATAGPWRHDPTKWNAIDHEESVFAGELGLGATCVASTGPESGQSVADAAHIARHDPARVLAECAARRAILAVHRPLDDDPEPFCWNCDEERWPCKTMAALVQPFAAHPDYDQSWSVS